MTPEEVLAPHHLASCNRLTNAAVPLVIHDTTNFEFEHLDPEEIGFLQTGGAGFFGHVSIAVDGASREVLGVTAFETLHRMQRSRRSRRLKASGGETATWEDRESLRWERGVGATEGRLLGQVSPIHVMDRENDCFQRMSAMAEAGQRFIIRARHNRVARDAGTDEWTKLDALVERADVVLEREVPLSRRKTKRAPGAAKAHPARKGRVATLHFASAQIELRPPRYVSGRDGLRVSVVHAYEPEPPAGEEPVDWLLMTTEPATSRAEIELIVDSYRARWLVEEFFKALKTGCAYEDRLLESKHALLVALALSIPIATSVLAARARAQLEPAVPAERYFSAPQLAILRVLRPKNVPRNPTLQQALLAVASLGGHWRSNGPPGWQILSRGMRALVDYEIGWHAREETEM